MQSVRAAPVVLSTCKPEALRNIFEEMCIKHFYAAIIMHTHSHAMNLHNNDMHLHRQSKAVDFQG